MIPVKYRLENFAHPSHHFYKGQKVRNLAFETLWFRNRATYQTSINKPVTVYDGPMISPNLAYFGAVNSEKYWLIWHREIT